MTIPHLRAKHITQARTLRDTNTEVEQRLWNRLRNRQLAGYKFRRQHALLGYVLDFACHEAKLGIELDGSQHAIPQNQIHDEKRAQEFAKLGWHILRFWNNEVNEQMSGVLEAIRSELLARHPHPTRATAEQNN